MWKIGYDETVYHQKKIKSYYYSSLSIAFSFSSSILSMPAEVIQKSSELESDFYTANWPWIGAELGNKGYMTPFTNRVKVWRKFCHLYGPTNETKNFAFKVNDILGLESTHTDV